MKIIITEKQLNKIILNEDSVDSSVYDTVPFGNDFKSGQYISQTMDTQIQNYKKQIDAFMAKYKDTKFIFTIKAGESQVPNPPQFKVKGSLALARANQVKLNLDKYFSDLISTGKVIVKTPLQVNEVSIGSTPYKQGDDPYDPKFKKEQFVNLVVTFNGKNTSKDPVTETQKPAVPKEVCTKSYNSRGGFGDPNNGFISETTSIPLGNGSGNVTLLFDPVNVPDMFIVEFGGKSHTTGFIGSPSNYNRLMLGTIIGNYYNGKDKPWWLNNMKYTEVNMDTAEIILQESVGMSKEFDLAHIYGTKVNPTNRKMFKLYPALKPYMLDDGQIQSYNKANDWGSSNWALSLNKETNQSEIKIHSVGLIGQTKWKFQFDCSKQKTQTSSKLIATTSA